jgi:hypothetical protein
VSSERLDLLGNEEKCTKRLAARQQAKTGNLIFFDLAYSLASFHL